LRRVNLVLIFSLALYVTVFAQQAKQYAFKHFSTLNGLVSNSVNSITQDKDGYIWMATTNGLQRYDGNAFLTFTGEASNPKTIPSNNIHFIFNDSKNNLWLIGENNTIGIFDTRRFEFRKVALPKNVTPSPHQRFIEIFTGQLLLLDNKGDVFVYVPSENAFSPANNLLPKPKGWRISHVVWDQNAKCFWMSADSGLVHYDPVLKRLNYRGHNYLNIQAIQSFGNITSLTDIIIDKEGNLLAIKQDKPSLPPQLVNYSFTKNHVEILPLSEQLGVHHFHTDGFLLQNNGRIWLYGMPFLAEWTKESNTFKPIITGDKGQQSGYFNRVTQVFEDRELNVWVASDNGVLLFNPDMQVFTSYDLIRPGQPVKRELVQAVAETNDGRIIIGTWRGGLFCYDKNLNPIPLPDVYKTRGLTISVADMGIHHPTGDIWITQEQGRIDVFHPKTNKVTQVADPIFQNSTIRQITTDTSGNVWFGTQNGLLIKWNYKLSGGNPLKGYELVYKANGIIRKIHYDYQGFIWVGTAQNGLTKIDTRTYKIVRRFTFDGPSNERLFSNSVKDITYYNDSTLMVAAGCLNIINKRTNKVTFISTNEGLPSNTLESVQKDKNNTIWMGMTNGICRLNFEKKIISYYDRRDGINYDKFIQTGVQQLSDTKLFFFTDHNFMVFDPDRISPKQKPPRPYITSFKLGGQPLSIDSLFREKRVVLNYANTSFSIDFSAMSFLQQRKLHYYYKLENLDENWIHTDRPTVASYNYLPPGEFHFYVKTENIDGEPSEIMAKLTIVVRAPFWKTWWFYGLIALLFITIWYIVDRERVNRRKSLLQVRTEIATNLHNDISTNLNDINILSEMAKIKAGKNVEQSKDFIAQISAKSSNMIIAMDDMLWSIDPANDSMQKTLNRIKELTDGLKSSYEAEIELMIDNRLEELELEMKLRHDFYYLYKDVVTCFVRNGNIKQLFINIKYKKNMVLIEILSNKPEQFSDFESQLKRAVNKRAQQLSANINFTAENKHIVLAFEVPFKY